MLRKLTNISSILLVEADFNFVDKVLTVVNMERAAEKTGVIPPDQYGLSKVNSAI